MTLTGKRTYIAAAIAVILVVIDGLTKLLAAGKSWQEIMPQLILLALIGMGAGLRSALKNLTPVLLVGLLLFPGCSIVMNSVDLGEEALVNMGGGKRLPEETPTVELSTTADLGEDGAPVASSGSGRDFIFLIIRQGAEGRADADVDAEATATIEKLTGP